MSARPSAFDSLAEDLEQLRIASGAISYTDLAGRIVQRRIAGGTPPAAAHIGRSTVYDVFRLGRRRVNPDLVHEIVLALGVDEHEAGLWRRRCIAAYAGAAPRPAPAATQPLSESADLLRHPAMVAMIVVACIGLNSIGGQLVKFIGVPLYLDMTGTAVAAVLIGPWAGVFAGVTYHVLAAWFEGGPDGLWFTLVNVTGALIWGYGVRAWRMGRTAARFLMLNIIAGVACSMVAVPILVLVFGGLWGHPGQAVLVPALVAIGVGLVESVTSSNLLLSLTDKLVSGYVALAVAYALLWSGFGTPRGLDFGAFKGSFSPRGSRSEATLRRVVDR